MNKIDYFDYFLYKATLLYKGENNIGVLKSLKLLFFTTVIDLNSDINLLDNVFDNFYAMPYGHIEYDIFNSLKTLNGKLKINEINQYSNKIYNTDIEDLNLDENIIKLIDDNLNKLINEYPELIYLNSWKLIEINHRYFSWIKTYKEARLKNVYSSPIDNELIKKEQKIFRY